MTNPAAAAPPSNTPSPASKPVVATLSRELADFLLELSITLNKHAIYPQNHPLLDVAVDGVANRLGMLFVGDRDSLSIGVARRQLIIEGVATDPLNPVLKELAQRLHQHQVGALKLTRGITRDELAAALAALSVDPLRSTPIGRDTERLGELWADSQYALFGDAVEVTEGYRAWWSYIPHFINAPGYVYAYAYGQLLAMSVYRRYRDEGELALRDRSSAPRHVANRTPRERVEAIMALRRLRFTAAEIAEAVGMALSTVSRWLRRIGLGKRSALVPPEPPNRYERKRAGELGAVLRPDTQPEDSPAEAQAAGAIQACTPV